MSTTIGCPISGASQPKEQKRYIDRPMRLIDAREVMIAVFNAIEIDEDEYNAIKAEVDEIPTIDPESLRPTAQWIAEFVSEVYGPEAVYGSQGDYIYCYYCSNCHNEAILNNNGEHFTPKFCPECGAKMVNTDEKHCT